MLGEAVACHIIASTHKILLQYRACVLLLLWCRFNIARLKWL